MKKLKLLLLLMACIIIGTEHLKAQGKKVITPSGMFDVMYDRFGKHVELSDMLISNYTAPPSPAPASVTNSCSAGYFNLYFENGALGSNVATQSQNQAVICQVYSDLSNFLISPLSVPTNTTRVNVFVRDFANLGAGTGALGVASQFYSFPAVSAGGGGIADGTVQKTIISGVDAYVNVASPLSTVGPGINAASGVYFHAVCAFDFSYPWNVNLAAGASGVSYDLYTVVLHEATHQLGFASLIDVNGNSKFGVSYPYYARYDTYLTNWANTPLLTNNSGCASTQYSFNPAVNVSDLTPSSATCLNPVKFAGSVNQPCYTPGTWSAGSSLSHLEDLCHVPTTYPGGSYYVMSWATPNATTKRHLTTEERLVLCDLGYSVGTTYGNASQLSDYNYPGAACPGVGVAGVNDGFTGSVYSYTATVGNAITIPVSSILANDVNAASATCVSLILGNGTVSSTGSNITFTPAGGFFGSVLIRYVPVNSAGNTGNLTYIYAFIMPASCSPVSSCDLVQNGGFEANTSLYQCGDGAVSFDVAPNCWYYYLNTPDLFTAGCTNSGDQHSNAFNLGVNTFSSSPVFNSHNPGSNNSVMGYFDATSTLANYCEASENFLGSPLIPGQVYQLSFWAYNYSGGFQYPITVTSSSSYTINQYATPIAVSIASSPSVLPPASASYPAAGMGVIRSFTISPVNSWVYVSTTFTFSGASNNNLLYIGPDHGLIQASGYSSSGGNPNPYHYVLFDDISILPINTAPTFTLPVIAYCKNDPVVTNLAQYAFPPSPNGVFSGPGVVYTGGQYNFDPSLAPAGLNSILYTFTTVTNCTYTAAQQITINDFTLASSATVICLGNSATLTATGPPSTYTWTPCSSGCNGSSIVVTPTVPTIYTVTATTGTCTNTHTLSLNVIPTTFTTSPNVPGICPGTAVTLTTSTGASGYTWTPCVVACGGSSITVSPSVTTTYTVLANTGCLNTRTISVGVLSSNFNAFIVGSPYVCSGNNAALTASTTAAGTFTYNWSPPSGNSPGITITPTNNAVYFCTLTNACQTATASICLNVVNPECCTAVQSIPANTTIGNAGIYTNMTGGVSWDINGPITITGNVTWTGNTYRMRPGAKITIVAGAKLTLTNCRLFSCTDMWEGIILLGGSPPLTPKIEVVNSTIEDAYRAIYYDVQNGSWDDNIITRGSTFNKNYIGIDVMNTSVAQISNTDALALGDNFKSAASLTSPGSNLKCSGFYSPTIKTTAYAGVYFDNQNSDIHVGDASFNAANTNTFDNLNYGVYLRNSTVRVFKSNFTNMTGLGITGFPAPPPVGIGIYSPNSYPSASHMAHAEQCTFTNVYRGMHTEDINKYYVLNCQFSVTATNPYYTGNMASYANNTIDYSLVRGNSITNFNTGIYHGYSSPVAAGSFSLSVFQNTVTAGGTGTAYCQQAITLGDAVNTFSAVGRNLTLAMNKISNVQNGIWVTNVKNGLKVSNNTIGILYASSGTFAGMKFNGSEGAYIDNNAISSTNTGNPNLRGIYMQLSPTCYNRCNTITNTGQAVVYEGNCLTSYAGFVNNLITNAYDGLVLKNNGVIGTQGRNTGITALRSSSGNQWLGSYNRSKTLVMDAGSSATNSNLQVRNNANENPAPQALNIATNTAVPGNDNYGTSVYNPTPSLIISTYANQACPSPNTTGSRMAAMDSTDLALIKAEKDSALFRLLQGPGSDAVLENETRELNRNYVYDLLDNGYTTHHAGLNAFYAQHTDSVLNTLSDVDSLILSGNYAIAQNQNNAANASTLIQQNQQLVNDALLKQMTNSDSFTQAELDGLNTLANKCPLVHGPAVYQARTLLCALAKDNLAFSDNCNVDSKSRKSLSTNTTAEESINLFPNPSRGAVTLKYKINQNAVITIYDISGRILYKHMLDKEATTLQLQTALAEGMYIYTIINDTGALLKTDKLVIIQ